MVYTAAMPEEDDANLPPMAQLWRPPSQGTPPPVPVVPVPAIWPPALPSVPPVPMTPIDYRGTVSSSAAVMTHVPQGRHLGRPGVLGAVGVMSIIVAALSMLGAGSTIMQTATIKMISRTFAGPGASSVVSSNGPLAEKPLPPVETMPAGGWDLPKRRMAMLALGNIHAMPAARMAQLDRLLADAGQRIFPQISQVTPAAVSQAISRWGTQAGGDSGKPGADYFVTATGKIEVYDDHGVFRDDDHQVIRVAATVEAYESAMNPAPPALAVAAGPMSPAPSANVNAAARQSATTVVLGEAGVSFLLAILLLVAGIATVRDAGIARKLHLVFGVLKLPLTAGAIYGWYRLLEIARPSASAGMLGRVQTVVDGIGVWAYSFASLAMIYPIALLIVMSIKPVRDYYRRTV